MATPRVIGYFDQAVVETEFRQKFNGCFVLLQHPKLPLEYWVIETEDNSGKTVHFFNAAGKTFSVTNGVIKSELEIVVKFPEEGWYLDPESKRGYLISRVPSKQWRRAPNRDNMRVISFPFGASPHDATKVHVSTEILNLTLSPIDQINDVQVIGRKYLLCPFNKTWSRLFYLDVCVAMYNRERKEYFVFNSWYRLPPYLFKNVRYPRTFNLKDK